MEAIKRIRELRGISQDYLARALCVDRSTVAKWETSGGFPRGDKIPEIAKLLSCSIDALYGIRPLENIDDATS